MFKRNTYDHNLLKHKYTDWICLTVTGMAAVLTALFTMGKIPGVTAASGRPEYSLRLFDDSYVHTIDLLVEDWQEFVESAPLEEYISCDVVIDGETFSTVGLRAKGNNSRRLTEEYELYRYSLKLEFDHYDSGGSYYGLDKLTLDASFQDNSYMKTYLTYDMMAYMGVPSPLCSYAWVTVNGEPWGLFLAVEEPEEAFIRRNFGKDHGRLYKPDYQSLEAENADVDLRYVGEEVAAYDNIFRKAKFDLTERDKHRLIEALRILSTGENLEEAVDVDRVLRYFAVQVFVMNADSYLGPTGHNYFLYEEDGRLSMLPWDYNLAYGTYCLGMTDPIEDPDILINYPVNTPWEGDVMLKRPMFHHLMSVPEYFAGYQGYLDQFLREYIENGRYQKVLRETQRMLAPYLRQDPTAFCSYEDMLLAIDTMEEICRLRGESIRGQLMGTYPATLLLQSQQPDAGVDASHVDIRDLGDFEDLKSAKARQEDALAAVVREK